MAVNDPISALEYNNIRSSVAQRLGNFAVWTEHGFTTSTTNSGYGRNFSSGLVVGGNTPGVSDTVTEQQYFDLFLDLQAGIVHQTGSLDGTTNKADFAEGTVIEWSEVTDLQSMATTVNAFNHASTDFPSSSFTTDVLRTGGGVSTSSTRSTSWGGTSQTQTITHRVTVNFGTHNNFLYFLAAGGEIRFDAELTGGTSATANTKDWDWAQMLAGLGTVRFGRVNQTTWRCDSVGGSGTGYSNSSISTGSTPTTLIFEKFGGTTVGDPSPGDPSGTTIYDDNNYRIYASTNTAFSSATQLIFQIEFADADTGTGGQLEYPDPFTDVGAVDESVTGTIVSNVYTYTPSSTFTIDGVVYNAINQTPPTGTLNSSL